MRPAQAAFVGRDRCVDCHTEVYEQWRGSDQDNAMDLATDATVLGDFGDTEFAHAGVTSRLYGKGDGFFVYTEGPCGEMDELEVRYTLGFDPLQQYLVPFPGGWLQALPIAWDTQRKRWFTLNPDTVIAPNVELILADPVGSILADYINKGEMGEGGSWLVDHPAIMTHASVPEEERAKLGISDQLIRLSVDIEALDDIIADLDQALS